MNNLPTLAWYCSGAAEPVWQAEWEVAKPPAEQQDLPRSSKICHTFAGAGGTGPRLGKVSAAAGIPIGAGWQIPQSSQKGFESQLLQAFLGWDPTKPVWVEAESTKIGQIHLLPALWLAPTGADCVEVQLPLEEQMQGSIAAYPHWIVHPQALKQKL
ncbi:MAG: hypothetical protein ACUVRV_09340 [Cyanobacteriota bacterium]